MTKFGINREERTIWGVRNTETDEVRWVFAQDGQAEEFLKGWLAEGGRNIMEVVQREEIKLTTNWH